MEELLDMIEAVEDEGQLEIVSDAILARIKFLHEQRAACLKLALKVGDSVKINDGIKPKYLRGGEGTVAETPTDDEHIQVTLGYGNRQYSGKTVGVPATCLDQVEDGEAA